MILQDFDDPLIELFSVKENSNFLTAKGEFAMEINVI